MLPKVIFFDLDDTIISFDGVCDSAWEEVCFNFSKRTNLFSGTEILDSIRKTRSWYWGDPDRHRKGRLNLNQARRELVFMALKEIGCSSEEYAFEIADVYSNLQEERIHMFPNSERTLEELVRRGIRLALITNGSSDKQRAKINRFNLEKFFENCFVEGELGYGKPDIRVYERALYEFRVTAGDVWMVGDNLEWDVAAPQKIGIYSIWNDYRGKGLPESSKVIPDRIINNISELL